MRSHTLMREDHQAVLIFLYVRGIKALIVVLGIEPGALGMPGKPSANLATSLALR